MIVADTVANSINFVIGQIAELSLTSSNLPGPKFYHLKMGIRSGIFFKWLVPHFPLFLIFIIYLAHVRGYRVGNIV